MSHVKTAESKVKVETKPVPEVKVEKVSKPKSSVRTSPRGRARFLKEADKPSKSKNSAEISSTETKSEEKVESESKSEESKPASNVLTPEMRRKGKRYHDIQIIQLESEIEEDGKYRFK